MLAERNPGAVYRRIEFDARVNTSNSGQLVHLCFEQVISALGTALYAQEKRDARMKAEALTRAVSGITALHMGVTGDSTTADALRQLYGAARRSVLEAVVEFNAATIARIRQDFVDIAQALGAAVGRG